MRRKNLTDVELHEICKLIEDGYRNCDIAKKFNLSNVVVSEISTGRRHTRISKFYDIRRHKVTKETIHKVCKMLEEGYSNTYICKELNLTTTMVSHIRCKSTYTSISNQYNIPESTKIKEQIVHKICQMMQDGYSNAEISNLYGIDVERISSIRRGVTYKYVSKYYNIGTSKRVTIDIQLVHRICKLLEDGYRNIDIAIDCGVSPTTVSFIRNGRCYNDISKNYNIRRIYRYRHTSSETIDKICSLLKQGRSMRSISKEYNVSLYLVRSVRETEYRSYCNDN